MRQEVRFGVSFPTYPLSAEFPSPSDLRRFVKEADELDFDSIWLIERIIHSRVAIADPVAMLAWTAANTSHIKIGTAVMLLVLRNPIVVAKAAATLDQLSSGRFVLGVSIGGHEEEYQGSGLTTERRVARLRESMKLLRAVWSSDSVDFEGEFYSLEHASINPKPFQRATIPIWMGGNALAVRARVAEIADGFFPGRCGPKEFGDIVNEIRGIAEERGRDPDTIEFGKGIYVRVDSNRERGVRAVRTAIEQYGQGRYDVEGMVKNYAVVGSPEECAERLSAYLGSDAPHVLLELHAISLDTDDLKSLAEVAALVKKG